jgi:diacylglycerol kinase family enzyme
MSSAAGPARRVAAVIALVAWAATLLYLVLVALHRWTVLLASVVAVSTVIVACWYVVSRRGPPRVLAAVVAGAALAALVAVVLATDSLRVLVLTLLLAAVSVGAAGFALRSPPAGHLWSPAPTARNPVLLMNPKSGGGKAERHALADRCLQAGIEPVVLLPEDDLRQLAEDAIAAGADLIGMAGGDGSQALVAAVASAHRVPFVVVPAGTRNHFALDLGIDREDVPGSLEAFADGVDVVVDLAEVNGRVFVNNAAMGLYATIVQSSDYRDAKVATAAAMLPDLLGPQAAPNGLQVTLPSGEVQLAGQLLLISNNPYDLHHLRGGGRRQRLDRGVLGAASVTVANAADAEALTALELAGRVDRFRGWREWTSPQIEVRSTRPVEIGVDGEALVLDPPLRFQSRPAALTVRLPRSAMERATGAPAVRLTDPPTITRLWHIALGTRECQA